MLSASLQYTDIILVLPSVYLIPPLCSQTFPYNVDRCHLTRISLLFPKPPDWKLWKETVSYAIFPIISWGGGEKGEGKEEEPSWWLSFIFYEPG